MRSLAVAAGVFGLTMLAAAAAPTLATEVRALAMVGAGSVAFMSRGNTILQLTADQSMRGRVMDLWAVAFLGTTPIGGPVVGYVAQHAGPSLGISPGQAGCAGGNRSCCPAARARAVAISQPGPRALVATVRLADAVSRHAARAGSGPGRTWFVIGARHRAVGFVLLTRAAMPVRHRGPPCEPSQVALGEMSARRRPEREPGVHPGGPLTPATTLAAILALASRVGVGSPEQTATIWTTRRRICRRPSVPLWARRSEAG